MVCTFMVLLCLAKLVLKSLYNKRVSSYNTSYKDEKILSGPGNLYSLKN